MIDLATQALSFPWPLVISMDYEDSIEIEDTRIMVSKCMVSKSKYWISEKNKGIPVSIFTESVLIFFQLCFIRVWSLRASTGFPEK